MKRKKRLLSVLVFLFSATLPLLAQADNVRIRTLAGMEPYGRFAAQNWGSGNATKRWNVSYGFTPGLEAYAMIGDMLEVGAGFRYQLSRRVYRDGGSKNEKFSFIPVFAATRFNIMDLEGLGVYAILRLGYAFFDNTQDFRDIWADDNTALVSTSGGMYGAFALGVILNLVERPEWGLDYSMDAGYAYHSASGQNASGKNYQMNYQSMSVDFSLDWRF